MNQNYIDTRMNLALAYAIKGDRNSAMEQYEVFSKISPSNAERLLGMIGKKD